MPAPRIVLDALSPLSHKELIGEPGGRRPAGLATQPAWVPEDDLRRLDGYTVLEAYALNTARLLLPAATTDDRRKAWREYGDVPSFLDRVVASVLGDGWSITVDGADQNLTAGPDLPDMPEPAPAGATELQQRIAGALLAAWTAQAEATVDAWEVDLAAQPGLQQRQDDLRAWADRTLLPARIHEAEHDATGLGDGVYVLWRQENDWPKVEVFHPGFYFATLGDNDRGDYPTMIQFGWEFEETDGAGRTTRRVRRMRFELVDINSTRVAADGTLLDPDGTPLGPDDPFALHDTDVLVDGIIHRRYPWTPEATTNAELPTTTCVFSDGSWDLSDVERGRLDALDDSRARWDTPPQDQHCDFITVVHIPNTPTGSEHYGVATFTPVAQLIDDIAQTDTRIIEGSQFLGAPTGAVSGAKVDGGGHYPIQAGSLLGLGENGRMDMLDLSAGIDRLFELDDRLADRLLQNLGAPRELMGKVDGDTTSGLHLLIKYLPWAQVIGAMRLPREPKYRLLLKFAQRLAQVAGVLKPGPTPVARLRFGNFMPMNQAEVLEQVGKAVGGHVLSTQTGLRLLVAAGIPIDDATAELDRIVAENPEAAVAVADALAGGAGVVDQLADRLGIELGTTGPGVPPVVDL